MLKNSKIYVAGGTGLVGSAVINKLFESGYNNVISTYNSRKPSGNSTPVNWFQLDLRSQADTVKFFEREKPDYVFLTAAKVGGILANDTYKAEFIYDNLAIALNAVNASYKTGVKKLLNLGSSCIYPKLAPQPMKEEYLLTSALEPTNEPYAIAKIAELKLCRYYNEQYGTDYISVMPTNLYGPNDNYNLETSHVLPALIRKFHLAKLLSTGDFKAITDDVKKRPLGFGFEKEIDLNDEKSVEYYLGRFGISEDSVTLWGTGEAYREFLYITDLADSCMFLMENYGFKDIGEIINIGTGTDVKIKELASAVKEIVGFQGGIKQDTSKPDGTPKKLLDVSRIKNLGWESNVSLKDGIKMAYTSYIS